MDREDIVRAISDGLSEYCSFGSGKTCDECASNKLALYEKQVRAKALEELETKLRCWDHGANAIPSYVWSEIGKMKEQKNNEQ